MPSAEGALNCDVLVVGGGYTGLWTAWQLAELEPEASVVVLEAGRCGHGPSGRNGGFVNASWFNLPSLRDRYGGPARPVARASQDAVDEIGRFCSEQDRRLVPPERLPAGLGGARPGRRLVESVRPAASSASRTRRRS